MLDLAVLSLCDHSVIDYGTYGLWVIMKMKMCSGLSIIGYSCQ